MIEEERVAKEGGGWRSCVLVVSREEAGTGKRPPSYFEVTVLMTFVVLMLLVQFGVLASGIWMWIAAGVLVVQVALREWRHVHGLQKRARCALEEADDPAALSLFNRRKLAGKAFVAAGGVHVGGLTFQRFDFKLWRQELSRFELKDIRTVIVNEDLADELLDISPETNFSEPKPAGATGRPHFGIIMLTWAPFMMMGAVLLYSSFAFSPISGVLGNTVDFVTLLLGFVLICAVPIRILILLPLIHAYVRGRHLIAPGRFAKRRFGFVREFSAADSMIVVHKTEPGIRTYFHSEEGNSRLKFPRESDRGLIRLWRLWNYEGTPAPAIYEGEIVGEDQKVSPQESDGS